MPRGDQEERRRCSTEGEHEEVSFWFSPSCDVCGHVCSGLGGSWPRSGATEFVERHGPPEQVVGSSGVTTFEMRPDGKPVLVKEPKVEFVDDKTGKSVGINRFIGRRPILAFGNSDGDLEMLQWTAAGSGARLMGIVHHTDALREYAYDRQSHIGRLDKALDEAKTRGWLVVDMKLDWKAVYPRQ